MVPIGHVIALSAILFAIGVLGVALRRKRDVAHVAVQQLDQRSRLVRRRSGVEIEPEIAAMQVREPRRLQAFDHDPG